MATQGQRRATRKQEREAKNQYDAAGNGRRLRGWNPPPVGPNKALQGFAKIRSRAQDVVRNDWAGESAIQKWTTALVGAGVTPRWSDEKLTALWAKWARVADADGVLDVYGMQALAIRSVLASGEVFLRRRPRAISRGLPVPVQVQLIESEFCPVFDADTREGMPIGNVIRQGIEVTKYGDRVAYWMHKQHPGDNQAQAMESDLIRVPARDVRHVYEVKRGGQLRGVSSLAPVLVRLRATGDFEDAVLDRQKLANLFTLFITRSMPENWEDIDVDPDTGLPKWYDSDGQPMAGLEPGLAQELKPGEDVKFANPPEAGVTFSDYLRTNALGTSAGQGLPYELFSGDIQNVSDRTLRVVIQEFRRFAEQRQWHMVIPMLCQPMVEWWADAGVLSGAIPASKSEAARSPEHSPHGWDYIHPVQDVQGKALAIKEGLTSRSAVITARGEDPRRVDAQRAEDAEREAALGLSSNGEPAGADDDETDADGDAVEQKPKKAKQTKNQLPQADASAEIGRMLAAMNATVGQMAGAMQACAQAMQAFSVQASASSAPQAAAVPPVFNLHAHVAAPEVHVAAPSVTVEPPIVNVAAPDVHVAAPNVTVEAPIVNVAAPEVSVVNEVQPAAVTVSLPTRQTETAIKRDSAGEIVNFVQTERTLN